MGDRLTGVIAELDKKRGFGFIDADGERWFFHCRATREFDKLVQGSRVSFEPHRRHPRGPRALLVVGEGDANG